MEIKTIIDDKEKFLFSNFLNSFDTIKFTFINYKKIDEINDEIFFIIFSNDTNVKYINSIKKKFSNTKYEKLIFFLPATLKNEIKKNHVKTIFYPININSFKKKLTDYIDLNQIVFENLNLNSKNILYNSKKNSSIYLTESECSILRLFFLKKIVSKNQIKTEVLKIKESVDSKSLETHLYRLRKKISSVCKNIEIIPLDKKSLQIKKINSTKG
tara:strand:+ start:715 stop:1356 length:642 start_codon:yes stop_codon:yes gene_type:complete